MVLFIIAYAIAMLIGEGIREIRYDHFEPDDFDLLCIPDDKDHTPKRYSCSGLFILLKRR